MIDVTENPKTDSGAAGASGVVGTQNPNLDSFKGPAGNPGIVSRPKTKTPGKVGRPSHADLRKAGKMPPPKIEVPVEPSMDDAEMEGRRKELENLLKEILISTTEDWANFRYDLLRKNVDEPLAKMLADKKRLSKNEADIFSKMAVRLVEKYIGGGMQYSDEIMALAVALNYMLRNREGDRLEKQFRNPPPNEAAKRPEIQSTPVADLGAERNGKNGTVRTVESTAPRTA